MDAIAPAGYQKIRVHFVYGVKHDLCHKARPIVTGGHLTPPIADAYSGVVSLCAMRLALLIGELNGLNIMVGNIGNAYLEAKTKKRYILFLGRSLAHWKDIHLLSSRPFTYYAHPVHDSMKD